MFWESKKDEIINEKFDKNLTQFVEDLNDVTWLWKVLYFTFVFRSDITIIITIIPITHVSASG